MKKTETQGKNFEASLAALEKIVRELERGDLPLEESLKLFEQGVKLSRECQERLNQAERRVEVLLRDGEGRPVLSAFDDEEKVLGRLSAESEAEEDESVF
jgi:exodeoxyribonuclease VII small subunit